jgi:hypothetical protein
MPPRVSRSAQAGPSNPTSVAASITPIPSPAPEEQSRRSEESLSPAPPTPVQGAVHRALDPEAFHLPEPRMATAAEVERLNGRINIKGNG